MTTATPGEAPRTRRFIFNVLWSWVGISVTIFSALILSPYVIRRLGDESFGVWALTTTLVDYYWLLDLGMRSATIRYTAHYSATKDNTRLNEVLNSTLACSSVIGPLLLIVVWFLLPHLSTWFHVSHPAFPKLLLIVSLSWVFTSILSVATSALEGLQRFDVVNKVASTATAIKGIGTFVLLYKGYGVVEVAWMTCLGQLLLHSMNLIALRRILPEFRFGFGYVSREMLRTLLSYGGHSVVASAGQRLLSLSPPLLIGATLPTRFVGYYSAAARLLDYTVEAVARIGNVSNSSAAELMATGQRHRVLELSKVVNRYSLAIFLPLSIFLMVYGPALLAVWLNPSFGAQAAGVLLALLPGVTITNAGQYSSGSILFGMGKHQTYSRTLLVEALLAIAALYVVLPRFGLAAGAAVLSALMILNRTLVTARLLTRELDAPLFEFLASVYKPLLAVPIVGAALWAMKPFVPGGNWPELIFAGAVCVTLYAPMAFFFLREDHRAALRTRAAQMFRRLSPAPSN